MKIFIVLIFIVLGTSTTFSKGNVPFADIESDNLYFTPNENLSEEFAQALSGPILSLYMGFAAQQYGKFFSDKTFSDIELKDRVVSTYIVDPTNESDTLYQVDLRIYSPSKVGSRWNRMVIIRPYDQKVRPCILYTHGNNGNLNTWANYYLIGVSEMLMRGYAVAFYENYNNSFFTALSNTDPIYKEWVNDNLVDSTQDLPEDHILQRGHYLLYQYAFAAQDYLSYIAKDYNIDENLIFTAGHSAGGLSSMMLTFADPEKNFQHPIFNYCGKYDSRSYPNLNVDRIPIKGVLSSAAGLQDDQVEGSYFGNYLGENNSDKTAVMIHGKLDPLAPVDYGKALWANFVDTVKLMGPLTLHERMKDSEIKNFSFINCIGQHGVFNYPITNNDNSGVFKNLKPFLYDAKNLKDEDFSTDINLYQIQLFHQQRTKIIGNTAEIFSSIYRKETIKIPSAIYTWQPKEYLPKADSEGLILDWSVDPTECGIDAKIENFSLEPSIHTKNPDKKPKEVLIIYPNPTQNSLNIKGFDKELQFRIMDITGKIYHSTETFISHLIHFDISDLSSGVYIVMATDANQNHQYQKFIVLRD